MDQKETRPAPLVGGANQAARELQLRSENKTFSHVSPLTQATLQASVIDACCANESNWEPESPTQFERFTNCGILRVERMRPDSWAAYRDDCELRNCRH